MASSPKPGTILLPQSGSLCPPPNCQQGLGGQESVCPTHTLLLHSEETPAEELSAEVSRCSRPHRQRPPTAPALTRDLSGSLSRRARFQMSAAEPAPSSCRRQRAQRTFLPQLPILQPMQGVSSGQRPCRHGERRDWLQGGAWRGTEVCTAASLSSPPQAPWLLCPEVSHAPTPRRHLAGQVPFSPPSDLWPRSLTHRGSCSSSSSSSCGSRRRGHTTPRSIDQSINR